MIDSLELRRLIGYDPITGVFTRLHKSGNCKAGSVIGGPKSNGYVYFSVLNQTRLAHRMAWLWMTGELPKHDVDHINGDRTDNRFANLREATRAENMQNERAARVSNKTSGLLGVSWSKAANKWTARIKLDGKQVYLGLFDSADEAHVAYLTAKRSIHAFCTI